MWSMVAQRLTQITSPAATPDQLWQRVEAAWSAVPQEHIQRAPVQRISSTLMRVLEAVDRRAPSNSKNWQWTTEDDISARRPTPASHGDESRFNLWGHDGRIRVRRYAGERYIPQCVIERHSGLTPKENARSHIVKTVRDFCSAQHMQLLPWSAYSPDMLPIEHVWGIVYKRLGDCSWRIDGVIH
ncbi:hypothetical protein TNCV_3439351 [Trichonephila clavipes]|nr:hypothetical protein TNCV_3439351 [Trichonephila clavipes]